MIFLAINIDVRNVYILLIVSCMLLKKCNHHNKSDFYIAFLRAETAFHYGGSQVACYTPCSLYGCRFILTFRREQVYFLVDVFLANMMTIMFVLYQIFFVTSLLEFFVTTPE